MKPATDSMRIFAVVGPFGVGKTTFVLNALEALRRRGMPVGEKVAYVVNDEGGRVDGERAADRAKVIALTNGCFTCSDTADLRAVLDRLAGSGTRWVFLEGFGITAGDETREFLESCPYPFHVLCLLSHRHFNLDVVRYAGVVKSHVRASTVAVAITKMDGQGNDVPDLGIEDGMLELVGRENPGIPLVPLSDDVHIPSGILDVFFKEDAVRSAKRPGDVHGHEHEHSAGCRCGHGHAVHGMHPYSYDIRKGVTFEDIQKACSGRDFLLRVKGAVGGRLFNEVHADWQVTAEDDRRFVTFYARRPVDVETELPELWRLIEPLKPETSDGQGYQLLRFETASRAETVDAIRALLAGVPSGPMVLGSLGDIRIITHPEELQLLKEIARRPYVKDEWFAPALKRCVQYWLACARVVAERAGEIQAEGRATHQRELGVSLSWWTNRYGESFGPDTVRDVESARPGFLAAEGIMALASLNSDPERAAWQCQEFSEALGYGLAHGEDPEQMLKAARHCLSLAATKETRRAWANATGLLEKQVDNGRVPA